jgi:hypothetical protein
MELNRRVGYVFGAVYLLVGLIGFAVTSGVGFVDTEGGRILGIFEVNPLHNIVHLAIGAALAGAAAKGAAAARGVNMAVGATYLLVAVLGLIIGGTSANILALNVPDHFLHLASGILLVAVARSRAGSPATA